VPAAAPASGDVTVPLAALPVVSLPGERAPAGAAASVSEALEPADCEPLIPDEPESVRAPLVPVPVVTVGPAFVFVPDSLSHPNNDMPPTASAATATKLTNLRMACLSLA